MANGIMELQLGSLKNKTAPGTNINMYKIKYVIIYLLLSFITLSYCLVCCL